VILGQVFHCSPTNLLRAHLLTNTCQSPRGQKRLFLADTNNANNLVYLLVTMDVFRLAPVVSREELSRQSQETVKDLHAAMTNMRKELKRREDKIKELEGRLHPEKPNPPFEDMFLLHVSPGSSSACGSGHGATVAAKDVDQILLYEESLAREAEEREEQQRRRFHKSRMDQEKSQTVFEDPVMVFVLDDDEHQREDAVDFPRRLVLNRDILLHSPPRSLSAHTLLAESRPILDAGDEADKRENCSQTEISAVCERGRAVRASKAWSSAPTLSEPNDRNTQCKRTMTTSKEHLAPLRGSTDTDELLAEAGLYLVAAKRAGKLVTVRDWCHIRSSVKKKTKTNSSYNNS